MRPTIDEQLAGTGRILRDVVLPHVDNDYAAETLRGLIANLLMLSDALPQLDEFVRWDNAETARVLGGLRGESLPQALREQVRQLVEVSGDTFTTWSSVEEHNDALREALAKCITSGSLDDNDRDSVAAHLSSRAARSPIRFATALPATSK